MILLPGQSANATVKRDASNNVVYGTNQPHKLRGDNIYGKS